MYEHHPLARHPIAAGVDLARPADRVVLRVTLDAPALSVMTDLTLIDAAGIELHAPMDGANQTMIRLGVRLLFVHGPDGHLAGLITATDILGEKPMRLVQERGVKHDEISVDDLMTPVAQLEAIAYADLAHAQVGHIVATLRQTGRQHTLVVETGVGARQRVRGIFSVSQISRQLGIAISSPDSARTFSELVTQLA